MIRELTLQRAGPMHAGFLTRIAIASKRHWNYPEEWIQSWTPQLTVTPEYLLANETWFAEITGEPAGFYSIEQREEACWLDHFWILPAYMGQGLGTFLFRHALSRCRKRSCGILNIESDPHAAGFYEKMGARKVGERHTEVGGEPRLLPILEIKP